MHPIIRIALFLVLSVILAQTESYYLVTAAITLLLLLIFRKLKLYPQMSLRLLLRLRWLFVSIFIVYGWFTPGTPLFTSWVSVSPVEEGIILAGQRILALSIMIFALCSLVLEQERDELVSAIYWYCKPLWFFGISREKVAVRILLTLDVFSVLQNDLQQSKTANNDQQNKSLYEQLIDLFNNVFNECKVERQQTVSVKLDDYPPVYQWGYPLILIIVAVSNWEKYLSL